MTRNPLQSIPFNNSGSPIIPPPDNSSADIKKYESTDSASKIRQSTKEVQQLTASLKKQKRKSFSIQRNSAGRRSLFKNRRLTIGATNLPQRVQLQDQKQQQEEEDTLELKFQEEKIKEEIEKLQREKEEKEALESLFNTSVNKENFSSNDLVLKVHNSKGEEEDDTINLAYNINARPLPPVKHQNFSNAKQNNKNEVSDEKTNNQSGQDSTDADMSSESSQTGDSMKNNETRERDSASGSSLGNLFKGLLDETTNTDNSEPTGDSNDLLVTPLKKKMNAQPTSKIEFNESNASTSGEETIDSGLNASGGSIDSLFQGLVESSKEKKDPNSSSSEALEKTQKNDKSSISSPDRSTRSNAKIRQSMSSPQKNDALSLRVDSPARNTRSNSKSNFTTSSPQMNKETALSSIDSPARNTRSKSKVNLTTSSPLSSYNETTHMDSPARNIRRATKARKTPPRHSHVTNSSDDSTSVGNLSFLSIQSSDYSSLLSHGSSSEKLKKEKETPHVASQFHDSPSRNTRSRSRSTNMSYISSSSSSMSMDMTTSFDDQSKVNEDESDVVLTEGEHTKEEKRKKLDDLESKHNSESSVCSPSQKSTRLSNGVSSSSLNQSTESSLSISMNEGTESESEEELEKGDNLENTGERQKNMNEIEGKDPPESPIFPTLSTSVNNGISSTLSPIFQSPRNDQKPVSTPAGNLLSISKSSENEKSGNVQVDAALKSGVKQPVSILNSDKKRRLLNTSFDGDSSQHSGFKRRTVAFGSPEAAEYNLGSPSMSMTPMHPRAVKAMFAIPEKDEDDSSNLGKTCSTIESGDSESTADLQDNSATIELETDINLLLDNNSTSIRKIEGENSKDNHLKPSDNKDSRDSTETMQLAKDVFELFDQNLMESPLNQSKQESISEKNDSNTSVSEPTVRLEDDLTSFLKQATAAATSLDQNELNASSSDESKDFSFSFPATNIVDTSMEKENSMSFAQIMSNSIGGYKSDSNVAKDSQGSLKRQKLDFENKVNVNLNTQLLSTTETNLSEEADTSNKGILKRGQIKPSKRLSMSDDDSFSAIFGKGKKVAKNSPKSKKKSHLNKSQTLELEVEINDLLDAVNGYVKEDKLSGLPSPTFDKGIKENASKETHHIRNHDNNSHSIENINDAKIHTSHMSTTLSFASRDESKLQNGDATRTLELEGDIESLLKTVNEPTSGTKTLESEVESFLKTADSPLSHTSKGSIKRKSRRISLATPSKNRFSIDNSMLSFDSDVLEEYSPVTDQRGKENSLEESLPDPFDLTTNEIIGVSEIWSNATNQLFTTDLFLHACKNSAINRDYLIVDSANSFLLAVCKEVEGKAEDCVSKGMPKPSIMSESRESSMKLLQKAVRSRLRTGGQDECLEQIKILAKVVHDFVISEWAM